MPITVRSSYPTTITIDGEPVQLRIKRMTIDEWTEFAANFQRHGRDHVRGLSAIERKRQALADAITAEQIAARKAEIVSRQLRATATAGTATIGEPSDELVRASLLPSPEQLAAAVEEDLSLEARAARRAEELEAKRVSNQFTTDAITAYVSVEPECIRNEDDGSWITTGGDLVRAFGPRPDVLVDVMQEIFLQNRLTEDDKKKLSSLRASQRSSKSSAMDAGKTPAPSAGGVASSATAESAAVTA